MNGHKFSKNGLGDLSMEACLREFEKLQSNIMSNKLYGVPLASQQANLPVIKSASNSSVSRVSPSSEANTVISTLSKVRINGRSCVIACIVHLYA
ncbi:hypothetical protein Ciccas_003689 [Cichlidogyrus casuarinus]|uniref:Uncharacterized protein n=1 Tax=Cichlidogyrus casuarinus TaxID=1844966 RepID=A0ABD2QE33_9PLAT